MREDLGLGSPPLDDETRAHMEPLECPFRAFDAIYNQSHLITPFLVVDFHAETTSEKEAMGWHADGRATAVIGTHTHVQTADEKVLPRGTGYLTDVGMTGPTGGILGVAREAVLERFLTQMPVRFEVAPGPAVLMGVVIEADTGATAPDGGRRARPRRRDAAVGGTA